MMQERLVDRRTFLGGMIAGAAVLAGAAPAASSRKVRVGIAGYGYCRFGADFGFQNHPNVQVVAVTDLLPDRREGLMKACRCEKSYESIEAMVKDDSIEAIFVATDAPNHAKHCIDAMNHGKHVMTAVPAVWGSIEDAHKLVETVKRTRLKYMMAETSVFHPGCWAMRQVYQAGGFGRLIYSEGEYFHYSPTAIPSFNGWRVGFPPLWYPTHSTAYYIGVTGKRFTSVSCMGFKGEFPDYGKGKNRYDNPFTHEVALFQTSEGGTSRMLMSVAVGNHTIETGRVYGERGFMEGMKYKGQLQELPELKKPALPEGMPMGGHEGSHGNLTHEFISSILEDRKPLVDVYEALAMTVPGIVAHQSALRDGERMKVPVFE